MEPQSVSQTVTKAVARDAIIMLDKESTSTNAPASTPKNLPLWKLVEKIAWVQLYIQQAIHVNCAQR